ncbi:MAG: hypothetical protein COV47_04875 [Candidatus Diapherotrites archaeon CG11_big_fil_rev_8_21_14_0_20_37_9]|nr:MAG: hypothetical protein COV47_04875 [Candidatus Diapherotrites archaeon CG11_big_fil_rev_8_21_14_0_20_37_9]
MEETLKFYESNKPEITAFHRAKYREAFMRPKTMKRSVSSGGRIGAAAGGLLGLGLDVAGEVRRRRKRK